MDTNNNVNVYYGNSSGASFIVSGSSTALSNEYAVFNILNDSNVPYGVAVGKNKDRGYDPVVAFKYIKKKFNLIEGWTLKRRLKRLEKAFYKAVDNGQEALGEKIMKDLAIQTRESFMYAKGVKKFIEYDDIKKVKNNIRGGHISDTKFHEYTRIIPKDVLKKKKKTEGLFDGYVIYHYYNKELEEKVQKKQKMSSDEISKMKDPILFGYIKQNNRLYFIADWDDEYCDLSFEEIVSYVAEGKIDKRPNL